MRRNLQGLYVTISTVGEKVKAFIPHALPPSPPIQWTPGLRAKFDKALVALGRLDSVSLLLPDPALFLYMYVRKEAVLSSMIEGTQSSLSDLLLFELDQKPGAPLDDVQEVSSYVAAMQHGLARLGEGFPLSLRLLKEVHGLLLAQGRGANQTPGEFRRTQNWIGGSRPGNAAFVPPPATHVPQCMGALELFWHDQPEPTEVLLKAALAHVQFETIHPFLDGNGRLGRLLITLLLVEQEVLTKPMLYLSLYFKSHRDYYYELLNKVRLTGDWEAWLDFFADAVLVTAGQAVETARGLVAMANADQAKIAALGHGAASVGAIQRALLARPIATANWLARETGLTVATVNKGLAQLMRLGVVDELTGRRRNKIYCYRRYLDLMNQGLEPLA